jgi:hypothetical protein
MNKVTRAVGNSEVVVAVLVSPDFGAGWSTWNNNHPEILFDPVVVNYLDPLYGTPYDKEKYDGIDAYLTATYDSGYFGGLSGLVIEWVQQGLEFMIDEYDGSETLMLKEWINFITA